MNFVAVPRSVAVPRRAVVCHAKPLSMSEAKAMSAEQIDAKVAELKKDLFNLRMKQASRQTFNPSEMPAKRKDIARLLTAKRQAEIEKGISKRESRRLEAKKLAAEGMSL